MSERDHVGHESQPAGGRRWLVASGLGRVAKAAALIADHPQPSAKEMTRILAFFGPDMGRFKGLDTETGEAAQQLVRAAQDKNGKQAIAAFAQVQTGCLGCYEAFREREITRPVDLG